MRLIDDKGRLLGKINIVDFMIILFILCLSPLFYYGYKISRMKSLACVEVKQSPVTATADKKSFIDTELSFIFQGISQETLMLISAGDKETDKNKQAVGQILSIGEAVPHGYEAAIGSDRKTISDASLKDLPVTLRIQAEARQNNLYYKDKQIKDTAAIDFVTDKYRVSALYVPALHKRDSLAKDTSDTIKIIQQKQKEAEYEIFHMRNRVNFLESKIAFMEITLAAQAKAANKKAAGRR